MSTGLVWFRNDLRISDNEALSRACRNHKNVIAVYFFDPRYFGQSEFGFSKTGKFRAKFLIQTVMDLRFNLSFLNISLLTYFQQPEEKIPDLQEKYGITDIYFQKEWTEEERRVEDSIRVASRALDFHSYYQQFLYHPEDIPFEISKVPEVFTEFRIACEKKASIRELIDTPAPLPVENLVAEKTSIPSLRTLGLEDFNIDRRSAFPYKGGESQAIKRLNDYFWNTKNLQNYKETRNGLVGSEYSSKLSAWLANGSISPRKIFRQVKEFEKKVTSNQSTYWLIFELIWRDFFKFISLKHGNSIFKINGVKNKRLNWNKDHKALENWINARTRYDFINANMRELATTGFMSNRGRQNVNSFLAKELCYDWRYGAAYFESMLIDYDVHSNWGNWMYNSGVGNDPRNRKFNIKSQAERYDPNQEYQNLWLNDQKH